MRGGRSAIAPLQGFDDPTLRVRVAAQVRDGRGHAGRLHVELEDVGGDRHHHGQEAAQRGQEAARGPAHQVRADDRVDGMQVCESGASDIPRLKAMQRKAMTEHQGDETSPSAPELEAA